MPDDPDRREALPIGITHPGRLIDSTSGTRKGDLARVVTRLSPLLWPYARNRIISLIRCPRGIDAGCFFQRHPTSDEPPAGIGAVSVATAGGAKGPGRARPYLYLKDPAGLVSLIQIGTIELHGWASTVAHPKHADWMIFDLDPAPDVPFAQVIETARIIAGLLEVLSLRSFVKTTGGKGLHVTVPLSPPPSFGRVHRFARRLAEDMAEVAPDRFVSSSRRQARRGAVFIDYLRNYEAASAVLPYSFRAHAGLPLAMPVSWRSLDDLSGARAFRIDNVFAHLEARSGDPWADFFDLRQALPEPDALARTVRNELPRLLGR